MLIPGAGNDANNLEWNHVFELGTRFAKTQNMTIVQLNYTRYENDGTTVEEIMKQAKEALDLVRYYASFAGIMGFSLGGFVGSNAVEQLSPDFGVIGCPVVKMDGRFDTSFFAENASKEEKIKFSPHLNVENDTAPMCNIVNS